MEEMNKLNYIVYKSLNNFECLIFPEESTHSYIFNRLGIPKNHLISAGFVQLIYIDNLIVAKCYGEAKSLNSKARENEDSSLLTLKFFGVNSLLKI